MIRFETDRTVVEDFQEPDFLELLRIYNKKENMQFISNGKYEWSEEEIKKKFKSQMKNYSEGFGIFAIKLKFNNKLIGEAGLFNSFNDPEVLELGYIIDSKYWNMGYGTEICGGLIEYGFGKLGLKKLTARMHAENEASERLSQKCKMVKVKSGIENDIHFFEYEIENKSDNW